jgi:hypothetical protein
MNSAPNTDFERNSFVIHVAQSPGEAIEILDRSRALRLAVVERESCSRLSGEWVTSGVYVLLWPIDKDECFKCYVGKGNVKERLVQHRINRSGWIRAIAVSSNQRDGFDSAEIGWLEGQIHSQIQNSSRGEVENIQEPGDESVPAYNKAHLFSVVRGVEQVMRLLGYELANEVEIEESKTRKRKTSTIGPVGIADLLAANLLWDGDNLVSTNGQWPAKAWIEAPDAIVYNGIRYSTPSAAGVAVRDGGSTNGWTFWAVIRSGQVIPLAVLRGEYESQMSNRNT